MRRTIAANPADYEAWYATPRGHWHGEAEYALAARGLAAQPGESLLDVGCCTGWFTRRAAVDHLVATGLAPILSGWITRASTVVRPQTAVGRFQHRLGTLAGEFMLRLAFRST